MHLLVKLPQPVAQLGPDSGVERSERLVQEQHLGLGSESAGEGHPLALTARKLRRVAMAECLELDELQQLVDPVPDLGLRALANLQAKGNVVPDGHVLERRIVLEDEADIPVLGPDVRGVLARDQDLAVVGELETGDDPEERRLARAARPEQGSQRAAFDVERDIVERREVAEALRDVTDENGHYTVPSLGLMRVSAISTAIAISASTMAIA